MVVEGEDIYVKCPLCADVDDDLGCRVCDGTGEYLATVSRDQPCGCEWDDGPTERGYNEGYF